MPSLLDSGSMVRYCRLQLGPVEGAMAETHNFFNLKSDNEGGIPLSRYVEMDIEFFQVKVLCKVVLTSYALFLNFLGDKCHIYY